MLSLSKHGWGFQRAARLRPLGPPEAEPAPPSLASATLGNAQRQRVTFDSPPFGLGTPPRHRPVLREHFAQWAPVVGQNRELDGTALT